MELGAWGKTKDGRRRLRLKMKMQGAGDEIVKLLDKVVVLESGAIGFKAD